MLTRLHMRDLALIDEAELELGPGMTVLTGETGAGKSMLVEALALVLGDRADATAVRHDAERAEVSASFDLESLAAVREWLREQSLDADGECLVRRVVGADGRSRAFVNGANVALGTLRDLGEQLLDLYGQQAHQSLLQRSVQRAVPTIMAARHAAGARPHMPRHGAKLSRSHAARGERRGDAARAALLEHQVRELRALALSTGEPSVSRPTIVCSRIVDAWPRTAGRARAPGGEGGTNAAQLSTRPCAR
jgi:DNA repair protein RecN (Recombination protein N)